MSRKGAIVWRLNVRMAELNIRTLVALRERLSEEGLAISAVQLGRLLKHPPVQMPFDLLASLCRALQCVPADLIAWDPEADAQKVKSDRHKTVAKNAASAATPAEAESKPRAKTAKLSDEELARIVGPAIRTVLPHPLSKKQV